MSGAEHVFSKRIKDLADTGVFFNRKQMHRDTVVQHQSLVLVGDQSCDLSWSSVVSSHKSGASSSGAPGNCHLTCLFSVKSGQNQDFHHEPSLPEATQAPSPSLSFFFSCPIHIFQYLLQRSGKQINEEKDPIILRPDSGMGGGE